MVKILSILSKFKRYLSNIRSILTFPLNIFSDLGSTFIFVNLFSPANRSTSSKSDI
jgi:hypothetical protein